VPVGAIIFWWTRPHFSFEHGCDCFNIKIQTAAYLSEMLVNAQ
jgi:hypothetical protein